MQIEDLDFYPHPAGFQARTLFDNGYGVSIIPERDLSHYELAVIEHMEGAKAHLCYTTEITQDVVRYATRDEVEVLVDRIRNLPPRTVSVGAGRQGSPAGLPYTQRR
jgi:hypothetical protein